ncbi:hypothetical protein VTJ83DRAFT_2168 [Remersonia thermophila]|uniref:Peptidase S54 rhomboid domain-containing protein n=1 Tax=Remersonia thermophila TaxID=72144 RepID=A0ABR4DK97_9PEZI
MNSCSLGVRALRPSAQAAVRRLAKPSRILLAVSAAAAPAAGPAAAPFSARCAAAWPLPFPSSRQRPNRQAIGCAAPRPTLPGRSRPAPSPWLGVRGLIGASGIITHYVDLPPNYKDEDGLPFARRDLEMMEVLELFGPQISTADANRLLRILHGRRVAGTLEDPTLQANTQDFSAEHQQIALEYLRKKVPVDEVVNAGLRAEDELHALEWGAVEEADAAEQATPGDEEPKTGRRLKLYKDEEGAEAAPPQPKASVYGRSALDEIRAANEAKWEALKKQLEEERKKKEEEEKHGKAGPLAVAGEKPARQLSPKMQEYVAKATSDLKEPPKMTKLQRLAPSALVVLGLVGLCLAYAELYRPARRESRLFPDVPPAAATVGSLIIANLVFWALWKVPPMWAMLNRYFLIVPATPRPLSMLSAVFSHQSFAHLLQNMAVLWFLGVRLHDDVGRGTFLATYFSSGALASLGTLTWAVLGSRFDITSLGASGAIYGVGAAYLWLHRFEFFKVFGLPPPPSEGVQGLTLLALVAGLNIGAVFLARRHTIDITSHLVGIGAGVLSAYLVEKRREARRHPTTKAKASLATKG